MLFHPFILFGITAAALPTSNNTTLINRRYDDPYGLPMAQCGKGYHSVSYSHFSKKSGLHGMEVFACCAGEGELSSTLTWDNKLQCADGEAWNTDPVGKLLSCLGGSDVCPNHPMGCCF